MPNATLLPPGPDARLEAAARRQRLAALLHGAPAGQASLVGPGHLVTAANPLFRQLVGARLLTGRPLREALPELPEETFFALLDEAYRTGTTCYGPGPVAFEDATQPAPGGAVHFTFMAQAVHDAVGAVVGLLLFAYNVTAHVQAPAGTGNAAAPPADTLAQLAATNERLAVVKEELDVTNEELLASNEELQASNEGLRVANQQLRAYNENMRAQATALRHAEQTVQHLNDELTLTNAGLVDTIADSLQATEAARADAEAQRLRLHRLVAEAPAMVALLRGPDYVVELANNDFRTLLGHRALVGQPLRQAMPELLDQPFFAQLDQVYRSGETYTGFDVPVLLDRTNSGQLARCFATYVLQATRTGAGHIEGLLVFAYEVTEQVLARHEREALQQRTQDLNHHLARTNEELDTFVYAASHDLQGPLTNIAGLLHELHEVLPPAAQPPLAAQMLGLLTTSVRRLQGTLTQLGTIARTQAAASQPAPPVALAEVVQGVLLDLAQPIAEAGAQLTVDVADCPLVGFSEKGLRSIVYNLVSNAVKYRHPDRVPQVRVHCRPDEHFWVLEVQDNGLGLTLPAGEPGFALFRRFHTHVDGSGVGLYLVQKLVEREGGRLEVASQPGQGSTFTAYCKR